MKKIYFVKVSSYIEDDYEYANIATTWKGKDIPDQLDTTHKTSVMWQDESLYGIIGNKIGDFIEAYGTNSSLQEGIFTHRTIADKMISLFTGLTYKEVEWLDNPYLLITKSGKPRKKKPKWIPKEEVDIVHVYATNSYIINNLSNIDTDFFMFQPANIESARRLACTSNIMKRFKMLGYQNITFREFSLEGK